MFDSQRLSDLQEILELRYEQLGVFRKQLAMTASVPEKFQLRQTIKREILPDIRQSEKEYWKIYPLETIVVSEDEATAQLALVSEAVESFDKASNTEYAEELILLLNEIRRLLEDLTQPASAKLKVALPLIPAIASYEIEMETSGLMNKAWESIKGMTRR
ncbi:hypothetical protein Lepto7376_4534 [[Leptolyngbya] sp. PCC 7376]|uniref:hypothetical protein n=1 Tax=[Leptolyngbya] sp. PCC 7376 TaxID=111781 RepID=UPI00029EE48D|nr:hypothetical protein [[Leptolyngbya] sp. PCC 7376]AFY40632.1 hypothetical protein Lepto7376_4534 [[Leptolyngbya] sp. PCC 7376]